MSFDRYGSLKKGSFSPSKNFQEMDHDPYSPVIVEDLLQVYNHYQNCHNWL